MTAVRRAIPSLESGDRLTRAEFHRRYSLRADMHKAELIEGVVYVSSPDRFAVHGEQHGAIVGWLYTYAIRTPGVRLGDDTTVFLSDRSEVKPDAFLFWDRPPGQRAAWVDDDGYVTGAPELIVEVAASSVSYDLHDKKDAYERAGVQEYIVWRVEDGALDWFRLTDGVYLRVEPDARGVIASTAFPGLCLAVDKLLTGDNAGVVAELSRGVP